MLLILNDRYKYVFFGKSQQGQKKERVGSGEFPIFLSTLNFSSYNPS